MLDAIAGGTPEATYPLIGALKSPVADVRAQAARALGERAVPIAREPLVNLLKDREPSVRLQAVDRAGADRPSARRSPPCCRVLADTDVVPRLLGAPGAAADRRLAGGRPRGSIRPTPRSAPGVLLAMEQVYDDAAVRPLAEFAVSTGRPMDERVKAIEFLAEVASQGAPVGRQVVGHAAGQRQAAGQDDRLETDAARAGTVPRAG